MFDNLNLGKILWHFLFLFCTIFLILICYWIFRNNIKNIFNNIVNLVSEKIAKFTEGSDYINLIFLVTCIISGVFQGLLMSFYSSVFVSTFVVLFLFTLNEITYSICLMVFNIAGAIIANIAFNASYTGILFSILDFFECLAIIILIRKFRVQDIIIDVRTVGNLIFNTFMFSLFFLKDQKCISIANLDNILHSNSIALETVRDNSLMIDFFSLSTKYISISFINFIQNNLNIFLIILIRNMLFLFYNVRLLSIFNAIEVELPLRYYICTIIGLIGFSAGVFFVKEMREFSCLL